MNNNISKNKKTTVALTTEQKKLIEKVLDTPNDRLFRALSMMNMFMHYLEHGEDESDAKKGELFYAELKNIMKNIYNEVDNVSSFISEAYCNADILIEHEKYEYILKDNQ